MELTQSYSHPSRAILEPDGLRMDVATELSRPGVRLDAMVKDSLAYARVMLALYEVVSGDFRAQQKDHTAYQEWVQQRYLDELEAEMGARLRLLPGLKEKRDALKKRTNAILKETRPLEQKLLSTEFYGARRKYFDWLYKFDKDAWWVLDPVVSVHPDCVVFEVFSIDESSYGRVTVPMDKLETFGETKFGTTNVDYSRALADEIRRVRSYRPAFLSVSAGGVSVATGAGERVEKKIDLPPTWVRGFLQCQSAATYPGIDVTLSPATVADVLSVLKRRREKEGPRSLRFVLAPGERPKIVIEPWGVTVEERTHVFEGTFSGDVRIWGRRRLFALADLMPYAEKVQARLLGSGMPSYWTVYQSTHRFDLGLSGWTKNDWSSAARFDLLAATAEASEGDIAQAATVLERDLRLAPEELAGRSDLSREVAASALQRLCREGRAMFDIATGSYRWRQLLPFPATFDEESDQRLNLARRLVATGGVRFLKPDEEDENFPETSMGASGDESVTRFRAIVRGGESKRERKFHVLLDLDADGRARFVTCDCAWHRREKLRKGPCAHILAATVLAAQQGAAANKTSLSADGGGQKRTGGVPRPDRFKDMTFVFTGALTKFTREQAEVLVAQGGGKSSGSVSRTTSYLVAGDKAGSKLTKAQQLNVPVLTEDQFLAMLDE